MASNELQGQLQGFLRGQTQKTIQRSYQFLVKFNTGPVRAGKAIKNQEISNSGFLSQFDNDGSALPEWYVKSVVLPQHSFKKELQPLGIFPRTFPVYESDGMELRIEIEEDENHNVANFIQYLQKRILNEDGIYSAPIDAMLRSIEVLIINNNSKNAAAKYIFPRAYFLNATEAAYSYNSNEPISYVITFGCDTYTLQY